METQNLKKMTSNRKFGYFFSGIFILSSIYFFYVEAFEVGFFLKFLSISFFLITIVNAEKLNFLNRLWMGVGNLLGKVINPIILGIIFFGLITPISLIVRLFGRDELKLKFKKKASYWINREKINIKEENFKKMF